MRSTGKARARCRLMLAWGRLVCWFMLCGTAIWGATLERLSLDDMIAKSTEIVRGRVVSSSGAFRGSTIYTHVRFQVLERWKGLARQWVDVAVPGGTAGRFRQSFSGVPQLAIGSEYVLFLWTGKNGLTQLIGLPQGVFSVKGSGDATMATRGAISETILDPQTGHPVQDASFTMRLDDMRSRVLNALKAAGE